MRVTCRTPHTVSSSLFLFLYLNCKSAAIYLRKSHSWKTPTYLRFFNFSVIRMSSSFSYAPSPYGRMDYDVNFEDSRRSRDRISTRFQPLEITSGPNQENTAKRAAQNMVEDSFDYLHFVKFLAVRNIEIIPRSELASPSASDQDADDVFLREGGSLRVTFHNWRGNLVGVKSPLPRPPDTMIDHRTWNTIYNRFMYDIMYEIQIMSHKPLCAHPNLVKLFGISFLDSRSDLHKLLGARPYPILVVEAACEQYPDLRQCVESQSQISAAIPDDIAFTLLSDIADGLSALHAFGVVHGDIKPENILIFCSENSGRLLAKVCDFGFSATASSGDAPRGHTEGWTAPECSGENDIRGEAESTRDLYSFGLVSLYVCSNGKFTGMSRIGMSMNNRTSALSVALRYLQDICPAKSAHKMQAFVELLRQLLNDTPSKRIQPVQQPLDEVRELLLGRFLPYISTSILTFIRHGPTFLEMVKSQGMFIPFRKSISQEVSNLSFCHSEFSETGILARRWVTDGF